VPDAGGARLYLRIRYNRGGREIEAAPTAALDVAGGTASHGEPLALPPLPANEGGDPRSGGKPSAPTRSGAGFLTESADEQRGPTEWRTPHARHAAEPANAGTGTCIPRTLRASASRAPSFVPLRT
jgi:hypothetical protein